MSREDLDGVKVTPKKKMTVDQFFKQFNNLDSSNVGGWPLPVKVTVWIFIFAAICAAGYFFVIKPKQEEISNAEVEQENRLKEFQEKDSRLRNSKLLQEQLKQMEAQFQQQLTQLPKETEIPALVEDINITGVNAGLKFKYIRLEKEVTQEFFIEQPITIEATGDYHNFGNFVTAISLLPRIVTLHDFSIVGAVNTKSDVPVVTYRIVAKTYRYKEQSTEVVETAKEGEAKK